MWWNQKKMRKEMVWKMFRRNMTWKKGTAVVRVSIMAVGMLPKSPLSLTKMIGKFGIVQAETVANEENTGVEIPSILQVKADFFDYNITSCQKGDETIIAEDKILLNQYTKQMAQIDSPEAVDNNKLFLFGGNRYTDGDQNKWTGVRMSQYEGIVGKKLVAGNIEFANGIYGVNIFPSESEYAASAKETGKLTLQDVVEPYYGKAFQFIYQDGIYTFDSSIHGISGVSESKVSVDFDKAGPVFGSGTGTNKNTTGFFPFNTKNTSNQANESRHHMFGMKLTIPFALTENGKVRLEDGSEKDMIFNFSGDDDVWIFIDGNLAIDLGGIHDTTSAAINFATGDITYTATPSGGKSYGIKNIYTDNVVSPGAISTGSIDNSTSHTLIMYYLERGEYDSNCSINFNISAEGEKVIPSSAPVVTTAAAVTTAPAVTTVTPSATPVMETPDIETNPPATAVPDMETKSPATVTPDTEANPPKTVKPVSKTNPPVITKPTDTPKPTIKDTDPTEIPLEETFEPTHTPAEDKPKPTEAPEVTQNPADDINALSPTDDVIIDETQVPDTYVTPIPTAEETVVPEITSEVPEQPDSNEEPTAEPTSTPVLIFDEENPSGGVKISPTPKIKDTETQDDNKKDEDLIEIIDENEYDIPSKNPIENTDVIVEDNVPSVLPKTGAIGALVGNNHIIWYSLLIVEAAMAACIGLFQGKRRRKN